MGTLLAVLAHPHARINEPAVCLPDAQQTLLDTLVVVVLARGIKAATRDGRWHPSSKGYSIVGLQCTWAHGKGEKRMGQLRSVGGEMRCRESCKHCGGGQRSSVLYFESMRITV